MPGPRGNDFPRIGINTQELIDEVERLLTEAANCKKEMGAVNWADLRVVDVEYRLSMLRPGDGPICAVLIEEASPECELVSWINARLDKTRFPSTFVYCEW